MNDIQKQAIEDAFAYRFEKARKKVSRICGHYTSDIDKIIYRNALKDLKKEYFKQREINSEQ